MVTVVLSRTLFSTSCKCMEKLFMTNEVITWCFNYALLSLCTMPPIILTPIAIFAVNNIFEIHYQGGEGVVPGKHSRTELELEQEATPTKKVERAAGETELASKTSSVGGEGGVTRTHITSALQPSSDGTRTDTPIPPVTMVMRGFISWKIRDLTWNSPSFYSHIGGYKMCLGVDANGAVTGADTHVRVAVYLMRGEYDDNLVWPFRGDVTLHLVNRKVDEGHVERTIPFNDSTPDVDAGRVTEGERAPCGQGWGQFISHSALGYGRNTEFLDKDALEFRVTSVKVHSS